MEDCHVAGYHIPKGTRLFVNAWKLHRDPSVWSDPEDFQLERFLTSHANLDVLGQHFELIPFGSGSDLSTPLNAPVDMREGLSITLAKLTPLEVMLTPRLPSQFY
ncbi:Cytochrome P450 82A3 [Vitis vinifera]|uniref:Cytochrome P450 82A3 n=1 Tax=Vitis vinifera TaxID=29760 RepID=A0A438CKZ2_VITVI|nr:Cytochrome P450 82A3 [Vitis vinifera]